MVNINEKLAKLPNTPGVYLFKDKTGSIIYVGKSGNLKNRVKSYFQKGVSFFNAAKQKMLLEITDFEIIKTESEISALIKESELIKKHKPKFNVLMRDSKNYLIIGFTKDIFPKIIITHQPIKNWKLEIRNYVGPFTDSDAIRKTLGILRDIFPYCTCKQKHNIKCLNAHMGKCLGICCLKNTKPKEFYIAKNKYNKNINTIKSILSGKSKKVLNNLKKEIKKQIKLQNFEQAVDLKRKIINLENILAHAKVLKDKFESTPAIFKDTVPDFRLLGFDKNPTRIETYDISNIQGEESVGSMVVFELQKNGNYIPNKNEYRKFKINTVKGINDPAMIGEIILRRFKNNWPNPQLIVIDGGKGQLNSAIKMLGNRKIRIVSLAKRLEEIYTPEKKEPVLAQTLGQSMKYLFQSMRDEAHRFAIGYHRKLRRKTLTI